MSKRNTGTQFLLQTHQLLFETSRKSSGEPDIDTAPGSTAVFEDSDTSRSKLTKESLVHDNILSVRTNIKMKFPSLLGAQSANKQTINSDNYKKKEYNKMDQTRHWKLSNTSDEISLMVPQMIRSPKHHLRSVVEHLRDTKVSEDDSI